MSKSGEVWASYAEAYGRRYAVEPVRNAKVNSILARLVERVGEEEAPQIAAFFVSHNGLQYVQAGHPVELLLRDAEKLAMEWKTGRTITRKEAVDTDKRQAKTDTWRELGEDELVRAIAITAEVLGTEFSRDAAKALHRVLAPFGKEAVILALRRCMYECRGRLTPAEIVSRIDDGRPGAEEAWGMVASLNDDASVCWTEEMATAWGVARHALEAGDKIGARMAFKEKYQQELMKARTEAKPARWSMSLGNSPAERTAAIEAAISAGRIGQEHGSKLLPAPRDVAVPQNIKELLAEVRRAITKPLGEIREDHDEPDQHDLRGVSQADAEGREGHEPVPDEDDSGAVAHPVRRKATRRSAKRVTP